MAEIADKIIEVSVNNMTLAAVARVPALAPTHDEVVTHTPRAASTIAAQVAELQAQVAMLTKKIDEMVVRGRSRSQSYWHLRTPTPKRIRECFYHRR